VSHVQRRHPRFEARERVRLELDGRASFEELWTRDISRGGMFVQTDEPPPLGTQVNVQVETPDGEVGLMGEVVHVLDHLTARQFGQRPGIGLQFAPVDDEKRRAIESYVDGLSRRLEQTLSLDEDDAQALQTAVRALFAGYEENDVYAAVGVGPLDSSTVIRRRVEELRGRLEAPPPSLSPPQLARVERALRLLEKISALLQDEDRRLEYDLRQGFVFAKERMQGQTIERIEGMRATWHRLYPERVREAEKHARTALEYETHREFEKAITAGMASLRYDPFNHALEEAVVRWREAAGIPEKAPSPEDSVANSLSLGK
jgi:uncharacterized protein (TIGR02266 family)